MPGGLESKRQWKLQWTRRTSYPRALPVAKPAVVLILAVVFILALAPLGWWASTRIGYASPENQLACGPTQLSNLVVSDTTNAKNWSLQTNLQVGAVQYGDRGYTFSALPSGLLGAAWIRTANSSKSYTGTPTVTFTISGSATVYVAMDTRITTRPSWLSGWSNTGMTLTDNQAAGSNTYALYSQTFPAGTVSLGPNGNAGANMYTIMALDASSCSSPTPTATSTLTPTPGSTPTSGPVSLSNLVVSDTTNAKNWSLQTNLQVGAVQYGDRGYTFSTLPSGLLGAAWIRTANSSKSYTGTPTVTFTISGSATVYVAMDTRITTLPGWLSGWSNTGMTLTDNQAAGSNTYALYSQTFPAGTVSLGPNGNAGANMYTIMALGTSAGPTPTATATATATPIATPTGTPVPGVAEVVYGQPNFTTGTLYTAGQDTLKNPSQIVADGQGGFYAVDYGNSRVLHFPAFSGTGAGPGANMVYGQSNYTASSARCTAAGLNFSHGVAVDPLGGLYISDMYNNRVLHYPANSTTPDRVYGQPDFNHCSPNDGGLSAKSLNLPQGIDVDSSGGLYVADSGNNRVLYYPSGSTTAAFVYGQSGFTSSTAGAGATGLNTPRDVKVSSAGVFIVDSGNERVLQYTAGNSSAMRVYGQLNFTSTSANQGHGPTAATLNTPTGIAFDALGGLYIGDRNNERVLFFPPSVQTASGNDPSATAVYGEPNFTTSAKGTTASSFNGPGAITVDSLGNLFVLDIFNQRVLKFSAQE